MNKTLQVTLFIASVMVLLFVLRLVIKNKMNIHYAMVWIIWAFAMVLLSAFPNILYVIGKLIGIQLPSNMVFLVAIFLLYCMTFYVFLKISRHNEDLINLDYEVASLKKRVEYLEEKCKK